jgi:hypothetical protein
MSHTNVNAAVSNGRKSGLRPARIRRPLSLSDVLGGQRDMLLFHAWRP